MPCGIVRLALAFSALGKVLQNVGDDSPLLDRKACHSRLKACDASPACEPGSVREKTKASVISRAPLIERHLQKGWQEVEKALVLHEVEDGRRIARVPPPRAT